MKIVPVNLPALMMWVTDAATVGVNGFVSGLGAGTIVGGTAAATTDVSDPQTITMNAAIGLLIAAVANGVKRIVVWHDSNPIPNPFKIEPPKQ